jgi:hypothetical protein
LDRRHLSGPTRRSSSSDRLTRFSDIKSDKIGGKTSRPQRPILNFTPRGKL